MIVTALAEQQACDILSFQTERAVTIAMMTKRHAGPSGNRDQQEQVARQAPWFPNRPGQASSRPGSGK
jgi:hypothetical protein